MAVRRPWSGTEDIPDGLAAHTGNDHGVCLLRLDAGQAVTEPEVQPLCLVFLRRAAGVFQRLRPHIGGDGGGDTPFLQQPDWQIAVVGADIRQTAAMRRHLRQQTQPWL